MKRKRYRGKYTESCLSAVTIAKLMGCHESKAKRMIYLAKKWFGYLDENLVGSLIQEVRNKQDLKRFK